MASLLGYNWNALKCLEYSFYARSFFNSKIDLVHDIFSTYPLTILTSSSEISSYSSSNSLYSSSSSDSSSNSVLLFFLRLEISGVVDFFLSSWSFLFVCLPVFLLAVFVDCLSSILICFLVSDFLMCFLSFICSRTFSLSFFDADYLQIHK